MTDQNRDEGLILPLEMIQRLYEGAGEDASPLPTDRTGGLRFGEACPRRCCTCRETTAARWRGWWRRPRVPGVGP
jgi:hypothetical protein